MRIGVFDSGIGGLTVLNELVAKYPNNQYYYFGDTANIPYGTKDKKELKLLVDNIMKFLIDKKVDIIIIACGTVSSTLYPELINKYSIPIYDIITPTINYINMNNLDNVALIATPTTVNSKLFEHKICKQIVAKSCPLFVPLIESGKIESNEMNNVIKEYLKELKDIEYLILGCTHYPIIKKQIKDILPNIKFINMGTILANHLKLENNDKFKVNLYFSKIDDTLKNNINNIVNYNYELEEVAKLDIMVNS